MLAVTSLGSSIKDAIAGSYAGTDKLCFEEMYFRKDIGADLLPTETI